MSKIMVLQGLVLENFKRHGHLDVQFSPRMTAIRGPNYRGKSSVLQGVLFALGGATCVPGGRPSILKWGEKKGSVTLSFELGGKPGSIMRTLSNAIAKIGDDIQAAGHMSVNEWVEEQLGMELKNIMRLCNSMQGETAGLLTLGATELNRLIEEVSQTGTIDTLMEKAADRASKAETALTTLPEPVDIEALQDQKVVLVAECAALSSELQELKEKESLKKQEEQDARAQVSLILQHNEKARISKRDRLVLENKLSLNAEKLTETEEKLSSFGELGDLGVLSQAASDARQKHEDLRDTYNAGQMTRQQIQEVRSWIDSTGKKHREDAERVLPPYGAAREEELNAEAIWKVFAEEASEKLKEFNALVSDIENSVCSKCKRAFDEQHLKEAREKKEQVEKEKLATAAEAAAALKVLEEKKKASEDLKRQLPPEGWMVKLEAKMEELARLTLYLDDLEVVTVEDVRKAKALEEQASQIFWRETDRSNKLKRLRETKIELKSEEENLTLALSLKPVVEEIDISAAIESQNAISALYSELRTQVAAVNLSFNSKTSEAEKLEAQIKVLVKQDLERRRLEGRVARFRKFQTWLRVNKAGFMGEIWESLLALVSDVVSQVTSGDVSQISRDPDGSFWFTEGSERMPVAGCASGAQKSIMGVAMRVALSSLLPQGCQFLMLDEPSESLTDELAASLSGVLLTQDKQLVLVTHRSGDESSADLVIAL